MDFKITKAARGIEFGDVSNTALRNILTGVSRALFGKFNEGDKIYTLEYFNYECPYTGKHLDPSGGYATDHIIPQNKEECGLNVRGNLIFVDKEANSKKGKKSVEEFLLHDQEVLKGVPMEIREARLKKIREFQKDCGYDPVLIKKTLRKYIADLYDGIRVEQEKRIEHAVNLTGLPPLKSKTVIKTVSKPVANKKNSGDVPIILVPSDVEEFKKQLLIKKQAKRTLTYMDKTIVSTWKADNFNPSSNLMSNIRTSAYYKKRKTDGLIEVKIEII